MEKENEHIDHQQKGLKSFKLLDAVENVLIVVSLICFVLFVLLLILGRAFGMEEPLYWSFLDAFNTSISLLLAVCSFTKVRQFLRDLQYFPLFLILLILLISAILAVLIYLIGTLDIFLPIISLICIIITFWQLVMN